MQKIVTKCISTYISFIIIKNHMRDIFTRNLRDISVVVK